MQACNPKKLGSRHPPTIDIVNTLIAKQHQHADFLNRAWNQLSQICQKLDVFYETVFLSPPSIATEVEALELEANVVMERLEERLVEYKSDLEQVSLGGLVRLLVSGGWNEQRAKRIAKIRMKIFAEDISKGEEALDATQKFLDYWKGSRETNGAVC